MRWDRIMGKIFNVQNKDFPFADYMKLNAERILNCIGKGGVEGDIGSFSNLKAFLRDNDDGSQEYRAWVNEFVQMLKDHRFYHLYSLETL